MGEDEGDRLNGAKRPAGWAPYAAGLAALALTVAVCRYATSARNKISPWAFGLIVGAAACVVTRGWTNSRRSFDEARNKPNGVLRSQTAAVSARNDDTEGVERADLPPPVPAISDDSEVVPPAPRTDVAAGQVTQGPPTRVVEEKMLQASLDGLSVMVVDDEPDIRKLVGKVLQRAGANVTTAGSAAEALEAFERQPPHVLLSDIGMPGEDGYQLIVKIRERKPEQGGAVPAAALTAFTRAEDRARALASGFQMHVPKPVGAAALVRIVADLAGGGGGGTERH